jgi:hypothetical protein
VSKGEEDEKLLANGFATFSGQTYDMTRAKTFRQLLHYALKKFDSQVPACFGGTLHWHGGVIHMAWHNEQLGMVTWARVDATSFPKASDLPCVLRALGGDHAPFGGICQRLMTSYSSEDAGITVQRPAYYSVPVPHYTAANRDGLIMKCIHKATFITGVL